MLYFWHKFDKVAKGGISKSPLSFFCGASAGGTDTRREIEQAGKKGNTNNMLMKKVLMFVGWLFITPVVFSAPQNTIGVEMPNAGSAADVAKAANEQKADVEKKNELLRNPTDVLIKEGKETSFEITWDKIEGAALYRILAGGIQVKSVKANEELKATVGFSMEESGQVKILIIAFDPAGKQVGQAVSKQVQITLAPPPPKGADQPKAPAKIAQVRAPSKVEIEKGKSVNIDLDWDPVNGADGYQILSGGVTVKTVAGSIQKETVSIAHQESGRVAIAIQPMKEGRPFGVALKAEVQVVVKGPQVKAEPPFKSLTRLAKELLSLEVIQKLDSPDPEIRNKAGEALLAGVKTGHSLDFTLGLLLLETDDNGEPLASDRIRQEVAKLFGKHKGVLLLNAPDRGSAVTTLLLALVRDKDSGVRANVMWALGEIGTEQDIPLLKGIQTAIQEKRAAPEVLSNEVFLKEIQTLIEKLTPRPPPAPLIQPAPVLNVKAPTELKGTDLEPVKIGLSWDPLPGASSYAIHSDGVMVFKGDKTEAQISKSGAQSREVTWLVQAFDKAGKLVTEKTGKVKVTITQMQKEEKKPDVPKIELRAPDKVEVEKGKSVTINYDWDVIKEGVSYQVSDGPILKPIFVNPLPPAKALSSSTTIAPIQSTKVTIKIQAMQGTTPVGPPVIKDVEVIVKEPPVIPIDPLTKSIPDPVKLSQVRQLGDSDPNIQSAARLNLFNAGLDSVKPLIAGLKFGTPSIRYESVRLLARMGEWRLGLNAPLYHEVIEALREALKDRETAVHQAAEEALKKLGAR